MSEVLGAALSYVERGWPVVPLYGVDDDACRCRAGADCPPKNRGKHPVGGRDGWRIISTAEQAEGWFAHRRHDNLGMVTGPDAGIFVLDVDGAAGVAALAGLVEDHGAMAPTRIVRTGSGGLHYIFRHPATFSVHNSAGWLGQGLDVRGEGGQVVAPPSVSGLGAYEVLLDLEPAVAPAWLLDLVREHARQVAEGKSAEVVKGEPVEIATLPEVVAGLRAETTLKDGDGRHRHFYALVAACRENGYTQGQTVTIVGPWCKATGKFTGRVAAEVARTWAKLESGDAKVEEWVGAQAGATAPVGQVPPSGAQSLSASPAEAVWADLATPEAPPDDIPASWAAVDLEDILTGAYVPEVPEIMYRVDGAALIYAGRVHSFHGESESGKSLLAQHVTAQLLGEGRSVCYLDFESDAAAVVNRLRELGADADQIRAGFEYHRPETDYRTPAERAEFERLLGGAWDLIVIDGVTDALGAFGFGTNDNDEISEWMRRLPRLLARRTEAAVILVDHVTKDADSRGRFAVGGQAKLNALDGAAYTIEVVDALGRGLAGTIVMKVAKDRPGGVRPHAGRFGRDRTQEAARVTIDSTAGAGIVVTVGPPESKVDDEPKPFRPTGLMERISRRLEDSGTLLSRRAIRTGVKGNEQALLEAVDILEAEGYVVNEGTDRATKYRSERPYRQIDDPASDSYTGWIGGQVVPMVPSGASVVPSPSEEVVPGPAHYEVGQAPHSASDSDEVVPSGAGTTCERCGRDVDPLILRRMQGYCPACARFLGLAES